MLCWQSEDNHLLKLDPYPFRRQSSYKEEHLKSHLPIPWSSATTNPHLEHGQTDPCAPIRQSNFYQIPHPHPWSTFTPLTDDCQPKGILDPCFASSNMSVEPIIFPNLINSFDRNPQHAARAALYTRYTPKEWTTSNITAYTEADINRNHSERLRNDAVRLMRQTDEKTSQGQRDVGRRLGERLNDLTFWRNELNTELEKLLAEFALLSDTKRKANKALSDLDPPLHVAKECLYHREGRQGIDKVHDQVEKSLLTEVDRLKSCQDKMRLCLDQIDKQLEDLRSAQHALQEDITYKESTLGIDTVCHKMSNFTRGINYFGGIEKYDPTISSIESWAQASGHRINLSQNERGKSAQLRSNTDALINSVSTMVWDNWSYTNNALNRRTGEMSEAKNTMQLQLHKTQQEIFDIERNIELLRKAIQDKANPLKVAQTRLEARGHRAGIEQCKDFAHVRLVQEVNDIQLSIDNLHRKLHDAETQHQHLLHTKSALESNLKKKVNALYIDREKCMGIRRSFPVDCLIKY